MNKKNIYLLDIDGVLANYAGAFCKYYNWLMYKHLQPKEIAELPFNKHLKHDKRLYESVKYIFRRSGGEARAPKLIPGGKEFINKTRKMGNKVFLWTSRPIKEFPNLKPQTKQWLKKNKILYDKLFFVEQGFDKEMFLVNSNLLLEYSLKEKYKIIAIDDRELNPVLDKFIDAIYLFNQPYNHNHKGRRIKSLLELLKINKK